MELNEYLNKAERRFRRAGPSLVSGFFRRSPYGLIRLHTFRRSRYGHIGLPLFGLTPSRIEKNGFFRKASLQVGARYAALRGERWCLWLAD